MDSLIRGGPIREPNNVTKAIARHVMVRWLRSIVMPTSLAHKVCGSGVGTSNFTYNLGCWIGLEILAPG